MKAKSNIEIKKELIDLLNLSSEQDLPRGKMNEIMKQKTEWAVVKQFGKRAFPRGDAQRSYQALKSGLEDIGIYLVDVGEIESFCPEMGLHGPKFVNKLLSEVPLGDQSLSELAAFVSVVHFGQCAPLSGNVTENSNKP